MTNSSKKCAVLLSQASQGLPVVSLNIPIEHQFCVDAGAAAAYKFFDDRTAVGLHDHIAISMAEFMHSIRSAHVRGLQFGQNKVDWQGYTDAFAAGYLGRIQQQLRSIRTRTQGDPNAVVMAGRALH